MPKKPKYPERPNHFAHRVVRKLFKVCAAQEIGIDACWLVTCVAMLEDSKRYCGPVTFWNDQLQAILGFRKWDRLDRARRSAVEHGWLHYEAPESGTRRVAPRYWALIPGHLEAVDDSPFDEAEVTQTTERIPERDMVIPSRGDDHPLQRVRPYPSEGDARGDARGEHSYLTLTQEKNPPNPPADAGGLSYEPSIGEEQVAQVAAYWLERLPNLAAVSESGRDRIAAGLAYGFSPLQLRLAIAGYLRGNPAKPTLRGALRDTDIIAVHINAAVRADDTLNDDARKREAARGRWIRRELATRGNDARDAIETEAAERFGE